VKCVESNTDDGVMTKHESTGCEANKHEPDAAAVAMETASSAAMETQSDGDVSDEVEEGELVSDSSSESELEMETNVPEKGNTMQVQLVSFIAWLSMEKFLLCSRPLGDPSHSTHYDWLKFVYRQDICC